MHPVLLFFPLLFPFSLSDVFPSELHKIESFLSILCIKIAHTSDIHWRNRLPTRLQGTSLWDKTRSFWDIKNSLSHKRWSERSERASGERSGAESVSEASSPEQASEWAVRTSKWTREWPNTQWVYSWIIRPTAPPSFLSPPEWQRVKRRHKDVSRWRAQIRDSFCGIGWPKRPSQRRRREILKRYGTISSISALLSHCHFLGKSLSLWILDACAIRSLNTCSDILSKFLLNYVILNFRRWKTFSVSSNNLSPQLLYRSKALARTWERTDRKVTSR